MAAKAVHHHRSEIAHETDAREPAGLVHRRAHQVDELLIGGGGHALHSAHERFHLFFQSPLIPWPPEGIATHRREEYSRQPNQAGQRYAHPCG